MIAGEEAQRRAAAWVFGLLAAAAFVFYTVVYGRQLQVGSDDLRLLTERPDDAAGAVLSAFVAHWSTVPYLLERGLYAVFGFRTAVPWVAVGTASWVATAALVRLLARQARVGPWTATVAGACVLACADIYPQGQPHSFQVPMAVAFGLACAALANRGGVGWGVLAGLLGIMTSSAAVPFVVAGTVVVWVRQGLKRAVLLAAPLALAYGAWYLTYGPENTQDLPFSLGGQPLSAALDWVATGVGAGFTALGHWQWLAVLLIVIWVAGTVLAWLREVPAPRRDLVAPLAVAGAGVLHLALTYVLRFWAGADAAKDSRYLYVTVATILPLLAVALAALGRTWRPLTALPVLLVVGALGNLTEMPGVQRQAVLLTTAQAQQMVQLADSARIDRVPGWVMPHISLTFREGLGLTTVDFLRSARDAGKLPTGLPLWPAYARQIPVRLGFAHTFQPVPAGAVCREQSAPVTLDEPVGSRVGLVGGVLSGHPAVRVTAGGDEMSAVAMASREPSQFEITLPGPYVLTSSEPGVPFVLCRW